MIDSWAMPVINYVGLWVGTWYCGSAAWLLQTPRQHRPHFIDISGLGYGITHANQHGWYIRLFMVLFSSSTNELMA